MKNLPEIPGYIIEQRLGSGGISVVYSGIQNKTRLKVAIKILKPQLSIDRNTSRRFFKEAEIISKLDHPNIVRIHETGYVNNMIYLVMEFLTDTLNKKIGSRTDLISPSEHLRTIKQIALALEYAHGKGIVHRDIKSENIMFRSNNNPVLVDFGLAKIANSIEKLTKPDLTVGTPDYMSPEQIQGLDIDCRTDIYSLGVVLYEMLIGEVPYKANNYISLAMKHLKKKIPKLPKKIKFLQPLLNQMMAKDRDKRVSNVSQLISLLNQYIEKSDFLT